MGSAFPASPTYNSPSRGPCSGWLSLAPSLQLPVSWAPHSRPGCLAAFPGGVQLPGTRGMGPGRHSQSVQAQALGPRVTEGLWF